MLDVISPSKRCPACEHRDEAIRTILSALMKELEKSEMTEALHSSEGLCLAHLRLALEQVRDVSVLEKLLSIQREKLEKLKDELAEFIRRSDYQLIDKGFGTEGDAWLRAVRMIAGTSSAK
jgi:methylphosphotriester-DNA--protein-cysteine methyltransferase